MALLGVSFVAARASPPAAVIPAKLQNQYRQLEVRAARQHGAQQSQSLARLAVLQEQFAEAGFAAGQPGLALPRLGAVRRLADQAMIFLRAEVAQGKTSGMREVEMSFQRITFRLRGLAQQVPYQQRAAVLDLRGHLENLRGQLLNLMFAPKKKR